MKREQIAFLEVHTWVGTVSTAEHFYGTIVFEGIENIHIEYSLTAGDARKFNRNDPSYKHQAGDKSGRFLTEENLRRHAKSAFRKQCKGALLLLEGSPCVLDPMFAIDGPAVLVKKLNKLNEQADKCGRWDGPNESKMQSISDAWDKLLKEYK